MTLRLLPIACTRRTAGLAVAVFAVFFTFMTPPAWGQKTQRWKVKDVRMGFRSAGDSSVGHFKPGLWTPVFVTLQKSPEGRLVFPEQKDKSVRGRMTVGVNDGDGIRGQYLVDFDLGLTGEHTVLTYANPSGVFPEVHFGVNTGFRDYSLSPRSFDGIGLGQHLYLAAGNKIRSLRQAMIGMSPDPKEADPAPRNVSFVTNVKDLPDQWFGYQPVDLVILLTSDNKFVEALARDEARIAALARWVRQGGRLIVSISWRNPQQAAALLSSQKWQPPLPTVFKQEKPMRLENAGEIITWSGAFGRQILADKENPLQVVEMIPNPSAEVLIPGGKIDDPKDIRMMEIPYGRGRIIFTSFELDRAPFTTWGKIDKFWEKVSKSLATRVSQNLQQKDKFNNPMGFNSGQSDVTTQLHYELDNFNVPQISFGWVALFILLFILIVGPLDYLILKVVFKRLEWTWITFPTIVIVITVVSYFTAYALKGNDLKINKVDLVDIDLRTSLDAENKTKLCYAYGTTWFSILSPRIQDYTLGLEPALGEWASKNPKANAQMNKVTMTWLGRPENSGPGGIGRQNNTSLFSRTYQYAEDATGLKRVPIPVWTTKAFTASWEAKCGDPPFTVNLSYKPTSPNPENMSGTIKSNLPVDMQECFLIYGNNYYPIENGLPGTQTGGKTLEIQLDGNQGKGIDTRRRSGIERWGGGGVNQPVNQFNEPFYDDRPQHFLPNAIIRRYYFFERTQTTGTQMNHMHRSLDLSWRVRANKQDDAGVRTAVLVGRLAPAQGDAARLATEDKRLPSRLWMGELPEPNRTCPPLPGTLVQETFIRVIIPVRPQ